MKVNGRWLNRQFGLYAADARYRENGVWYHPLKKFPGVLFDGGGYLRFESEADYLNSGYVKHGPDPNHIHVRNGISSVPGYQQLIPAPKTFA